MKKIVVFKEKHGERYFDASTTLDLYVVCIKIVLERYKSGYWYNDLRPRDEKLLSKILNKEDAGYNAYKFICGRATAEYEGFSVENIEKI